MTPTLDPNLAQLLAAWRRREEVRQAGTIAELAQARFALDDARLAVYRSRN